jgi:hypothetical protein
MITNHNFCIKLEPLVIYLQSADRICPVYKHPSFDCVLGWLLSIFIFTIFYSRSLFNPLNAELNPSCHLLALLGGATIVVVSRLRVNIFLSSLLILSRLLHITKLIVTYLFNFLVTCMFLCSNFHSRILSMAHWLMCLLICLYVKTLWGYITTQFHFSRHIISYLKLWRSIYSLRTDNFIYCCLYLSTGQSPKGKDTVRWC